MTNAVEATSGARIAPVGTTLGDPPERYGGSSCLSSWSFGSIVGLLRIAGDEIIVARFLDEGRPTAMEELRELDGLTLEELEAQSIELLPAREELWRGCSCFHHCCDDDFFRHCCDGFFRHHCDDFCCDDD